MKASKLIKKIEDKVNGRIESKMLIKFFTKCNDSDFILDFNISIINVVQILYASYRIKRGIPLQYIIKKQEFYGYEFFVNKNVLIPQPATEKLVEQTIKEIKNNFKKVKILDLCTGSGVIAISLKKELDKINIQTEIIASDISNKALKIAKYNAIKNNVDIKFVQSNMFDNIKEQFDIIVSNPPYIKTEDLKKLPKDVKKEPKIALDGGTQGMDFYKKIYENRDKANKLIILEIGFNQKNEVLKLFKKAECIKDYEGQDRIVLYRK